MKRFVLAACVAGAVIFSAAGCCSSCGSKNASPAPAYTPYSTTTPVVAKPGMPAAAPVSGYGYAGKGSPQMNTPTVQTGSATVTGEMPSNYKMPGN
jgi:hypothetical protein